MADNIQLNQGQGGDILAADDIGGGVKVAYVKSAFGSDGALIPVTDTAPMPTVPKALVDTANSSTTPLGGAGVFTGTAVDVSEYSIITVMMDADVDGMLSMQLSTDGTNWDRAKVVVLDQTIGSGSVHTLEVVSQFFRVVFTNGAGAQAHFRLQTIYHAAKSGFLTSSPDQVISKVNDAQLVRVANSPMLDVSRGLYADKNAVHKVGHNAAVPNGSYADIWSTGGVYPWPTTAETIRVKSGGNAADAAAGAGARTMQVIFLNATGVKIQEQLTLAGASASAATTSTCTRLLHAWVDTTGAANVANTGLITIENTSANQILADIEVGEGEYRGTIFTVPLGNTAYLISINLRVAVGTNKDADVRMWQRRDALTFSAPFGAKRLVHTWAATQGNVPIKYEALPSFPALTDIWFEAQGNGAITDVGVDYNIVLVKDEAPTTPQ